MYSKRKAICGAFLTLGVATGTIINAGIAAAAVPADHQVREPTTEGSGTQCSNGQGHEQGQDPHENEADAADLVCPGTGGGAPEVEDGEPEVDEADGSVPETGELSEVVSEVEETDEVVSEVDDLGDGAEHGEVDETTPEVGEVEGEEPEVGEVEGTVPPVDEADGAAPEVDQADGDGGEVDGGDTEVPAGDEVQGGVEIGDALTVVREQPVAPAVIALPEVSAPVAVAPEAPVVMPAVHVAPAVQVAPAPAAVVAQPAPRRSTPVVVSPVTGIREAPSGTTVSSSSEVLGVQYSRLARTGLDPLLLVVPALGLLLLGGAMVRTSRPS